MKPQSYEKLESPIRLIDGCDDIFIQEWRSTPGLMETTGPTSKSIKVINEICNLSLNKFPEFAKKKGFVIKSVDEKFHTTICMMPADVYDQGTAPRNLNDLKFRFAKRTIRYPLWGYFQRQQNYLYLRNDVLRNNGRINYRFKTVFAHELYHALSYYYGIYYQYSGDKNKIDEQLAQDFSAYLGLGR